MKEYYQENAKRHRKEAEKSLVIANEAENNLLKFKIWERKFQKFYKKLGLTKKQGIKLLEKVKTIKNKNEFDSLVNQIKQEK